MEQENHGLLRPSEVRLTKLNNLKTLSLNHNDENHHTELLAELTRYRIKYTDREFRHQILHSLHQLLSQENCTGILPPLLDTLYTQLSTSFSQPSESFVILEWCTVISDVLSSKPNLWNKHYTKLIDVELLALNHCLTRSKRHNIVSRSFALMLRAYGKLLDSGTNSDQYIINCLDYLTASSPLCVPRVKCATLLGAISHVCLKYDSEDSLITRSKPDIFSFIAREILAANTHIDLYLVNHLDKFFSIVTLDEVIKYFASPIEKGLLRNPEYLLQGLLCKVFALMSPSVDLSEFLDGKLLGNIIQCVNSSNSALRNGAVDLYVILLRKTTNHAAVERIFQSISATLKSSNLAPEKRAACLKMLNVLPCSEGLSSNVASTIAALATKETNLSILATACSSLTTHCLSAIKGGHSIDQITFNSFKQGISSVNPAIRKHWVECLGSILYTLNPQDLSRGPASPLVEIFLNTTLNIWNEIIANPAVAGVQGNSVVAYVIAVVLLTLFSDTQSHKFDKMVQNFGILAQALSIDPKSSILYCEKVYMRLNSADDISWVIKFLDSVSILLNDNPSPDVISAYTNCLTYLACSTYSSAENCSRVLSVLSQVFLKHPVEIFSATLESIWYWIRYKSNSSSCSSVPKTSNLQYDKLHYVLLEIFPPPDSIRDNHVQGLSSFLSEKLPLALPLCQRSLIPTASWTQLCLRVGIDPYQVVTENVDQIMLGLTQTHALLTEGLAVADALAELTFIAPEIVFPKWVNLIREDLCTSQLDSIGPTEAGIFRTAEGQLYSDVIVNNTSNASLLKKTKDYETLKWEEDVKAQLADKKGESRKLKAADQAKVDAQLAKESSSRKQVHEILYRISRGLSYIQALLNRSPVETGLWLSPVINCLLQVIRSDRYGLLDAKPVELFLECSDYVPLHEDRINLFSGVATLRLLDAPHIPSELFQEPLNDLCLRILHRLRFLSEQKLLDFATLVYVEPLLITTLEQCCKAESITDIIDEQVILVLEILEAHIDLFADYRMNRSALISILIRSLEKLTSHLKIVRSCLLNYLRACATDIIEEELKVLFDAAIRPDVTVRNTILTAVDADISLDGGRYYYEIWLACHDDDVDCAALARSIYEETEFPIKDADVFDLISLLSSQHEHLRNAAAKTIGETVDMNPSVFEECLNKLQAVYMERIMTIRNAKEHLLSIRDRKNDSTWTERLGIALTWEMMAKSFDPEHTVSFMQFLIQENVLGDGNTTVRGRVVSAATQIISFQGRQVLEELLLLFENTLTTNKSKKSETTDYVDEALVVLYGTLAKFLPSQDSRMSHTVSLLFKTLETSSESVQHAIAQCIKSLIPTSPEITSSYVPIILDRMISSNDLSAQRGFAIGLAGLVSGSGLYTINIYNIMPKLKSAAENRKFPNERLAAFMGYRRLSQYLEHLFEPYIFEIIPLLLTGFGDNSIDVRNECLEVSKTFYPKLSSYGVKRILPILLGGLEDTNWRSKKGACDLLGAMAYLNPDQLASSLSEIIPSLSTVLSDAHKEVCAASNLALQRFKDVIQNPEVKKVSGELLKALSEPNKYTEKALDVLIKISFKHYLDTSSLAIIVHILQRGFEERSSTKKKAAQIIASLSYLTERRDLISHLPVLISGLKLAVADLVPDTRATASKALGSLVEKLGEEVLPDLVSNLMNVLKMDTGVVERMGSAQALSEVLAGLGTSRLDDVLPTILQNLTNSKASVRKGFLTLFIYLPACFGNNFANYLGKVIPPVLRGIADEVDSIREISLRAGRLLVKNFASRSVELLLPELERGLLDDKHRIRLSCVDLIGDLLFNLTGMKGKSDEVDDETTKTHDASKTLMTILGRENFNNVLATIFISRCDTSGLVQGSASNIWKSLVSSNRVLKELFPTISSMIIHRLAGSSMEQKVIAGNALVELIRKAGDEVLAKLIPTLLDEMHNSKSSSSRQGVCFALGEVVKSAVPDTIESFTEQINLIIETGLVDGNSDVREAAAGSFDIVQNILGERAVENILPRLLVRFKNENEAPNVLAAFLTLLTNEERSEIILPGILEMLIDPPLTEFSAKALASLSKAAVNPMIRKLEVIIGKFFDECLSCSDEELKRVLNESLVDIIIHSDSDVGAQAVLEILMKFVEKEDKSRQILVLGLLGRFLGQNRGNHSNHQASLIRILMRFYRNSEIEVVRTAVDALQELTKRATKPELLELIGPGRDGLRCEDDGDVFICGLNIPKGVGAILPIFMHGLVYGNQTQSMLAAQALSELVWCTDDESLKPYVTQITGSSIRSVFEKSAEVRAEVLNVLMNLMKKVFPTMKPFLPQLQRTFSKALLDKTSKTVQVRAGRALSLLVEKSQRANNVVPEMLNGLKDITVESRQPYIDTLDRIVFTNGCQMNEDVMNGVINLVDADGSAVPEQLTLCMAKLYGSVLMHLKEDKLDRLLRNRVFNSEISVFSVLAFNDVLLKREQVIHKNYGTECRQFICRGIEDSRVNIVTNMIRGIGRYTLTEQNTRNRGEIAPLMEKLCNLIRPGDSSNISRLALVVIRIFGVRHGDIVGGYLVHFVPAIMRCVRDTIIPVKLAAEAAFIAIFSMDTRQNELFDKFMKNGAGKLTPDDRVMLQEYSVIIQNKISNGTVCGSRKLTETFEEDVHEIFNNGSNCIETDSI